MAGSITVGGPAQAVGGRPAADLRGPPAHLLAADAAAPPQEIFFIFPEPEVTATGDLIVRDWRVCCVVNA